jgi:peroxiredoxin Q/BCP
VSKNSPLRVGDKIPHFSLPDQNGNTLRIEDYLGSKKLVIFFYPKDGSLNCTRQACYFRDIYDLFEETGSEVIGISEQSVESHNHFSKTNRLNYHILSDPENQVRNKFGVPSRVFGMVQGRVTYVVNLKGEVVYIYDSQTKTQKHVDEALRIVMLLKKADHI